MPGLDHRLGEQRIVGRPRARDGGDGVHRAPRAGRPRRRPHAAPGTPARGARLRPGCRRRCRRCPRAPSTERSASRGQPGSRPCRRASIAAVGIAAASESTVCEPSRAGAISSRSVSRSCGFTAITATVAPRPRPRSTCRPRRRNARAARSPAPRDAPLPRCRSSPKLCSPARSASPIFPTPRIAIRIA